MGWPKGKRRKPAPFHECDDPVPPEIAAFIAEFGSNLGDPVDYPWTRSDSMRQNEIALFEFVESGEHIEADKYHPGLKDTAEALCKSLIARDRKLREGAASKNAERASKAEVRRQWIAQHCKASVFERSRKRGAADIQASLSAAGLAVPSDSRIYADIARIRKGWGEHYYSQAKDKA
ncbi:MAG: hypothetical protein M0Z99_30515 [Betaproteobacteria bacterium]|nr:hypothetical protein [Betaproteobacteria bacterium]